MSKLMYFDFSCEGCNKTVEQFVKPDVLYMPCPDCKVQMRRLISAPRISLPGTDPSFPGAYNKWEKTQANKRKVEKKHYDSTGQDYLSGADVQR